jgi:nucleoside-diphosphate-sugar epimerase
VKSYLIAGGAGFIGSHLSEALLARGDKIYCIDNLITGEEKNISHLLDNPNFVFTNFDIINGVPPVSGHIDGIFHLASPASPNTKSPRSFIAYPIETLMVNSQGTKNLLDLATREKAVFLYASSSEVYGDPQVSPQGEDYFGNVNPNGPRSVYDEGKRYGEAICAAYARTLGLDARIVRIFNTYGDHMQKDDGRVVSNFVNQALAGDPITIYGDGNQTRSFCYISDMVDGLIAIQDAKNLKGQVINLGNPEEHKISDLANIIKRLTESDSKIVHEDLPQDDPKKRKPDITRAKQLLNFEPKVGLEEGLKKTIEYFKEV